MDTIKKLTDREQAREKLPIFFGSRDNYYHPIKEMIANAADELMTHKQENPTIEITLSKGENGENTQIIVSDNGRGIPIDGKTGDDYNYELLFLTLFAGTKYDVDDVAKTGTNGVGNTAINYTSTLFAVQSLYNGFSHKIRFKNGGEIDGDGLVKYKLEEELKDAHGSTFVFELDKRVYTNIVFDPIVVKEIVKHFAVAANEITFKFKHNEEIETFKYEGIRDRFDELVGSTTTSGIFTLGEVENVSDVSQIDGQVVTEKNKYNIILTTSPDTHQESYLNMTWLEEGGAINDGVLDGIRLYMNKYCRDKKLFPKKVTAFNKEDIENSLSFIAVVESNIVEFSNQTKLSTNKKKYKDEVKVYIENLLTAMEAQQPKEFNKFVDHLLTVQKANGANDRARQKLKKQLTEKVTGIGNKIEKLIDCEIHGLDAELFLTEGDSANGSIVDSRDDHFQAAFPLRGKVLNVLRATPEDIFKNKEIVNMIKIIGTGIQFGKKDEFDIDNLRFGKIILTTDADADGGHIASLLIAFIYRFMKPLLENGHVYVAQTPLYELKFKDDSVVYFLNEDDKVKNIGKYEGQKYTINRLKGLGEVDAETMEATTMNPKTRNLIQLTVEDGKSNFDMIEKWMGDEVSYRKDMINEQLPSYVNDID